MFNCTLTVVRPDNTRESYASGLFATTAEMYDAAQRIVDAYNKHSADGTVTHLEFAATKALSAWAYSWEWAFDAEFGRFEPVFNNDHTCTYGETPDGWGCATCLYS